MKSLLVLFLSLCSFSVFAQNNTFISELNGIKTNTDIILKEAPKSYQSYYVSQISTDGTVSLYVRSTGVTLNKTINDVAQKRVTILSDQGFDIQTVSGQKSVTLKSSTDVVLKLEDQKFKSYYVSTVYSDGAVVFYDRSISQGFILESNDVRSHYIESWLAIGNTKVNTDIIVRDTDKIYKSYYVSAIYSDGSIALYDRATSTTTMTSASTLESKQVLLKNGITVTIQYLEDKKDIDVKINTDIILKTAKNNYTGFYVSDIYSDDVIALYNRSVGKTSYLTKEELSDMLVVNISSVQNDSVHEISVSTDIALRTSPENPIDRQDYYIADIYSDGVVILYSRVTGTSQFLSASAVADQAIHTVTFKDMLNVKSVYNVEINNEVKTIGIESIYEDDVIRYSILPFNENDNLNKTFLTEIADLKSLKEVCNRLKDLCSSWWQPKVDAQPSNKEVKPKQDFSLSVSPAELIQAVKKKLDTLGKTYVLTSPEAARIAPKSVIISIDPGFLKSTCSIAVKNGFNSKGVTKKIKKNDIDDCLDELNSAF
jgi:hypothetical protein